MPNFTWIISSGAFCFCYSLAALPSALRISLQIPPGPTDWSVGYPLSQRGSPPQRANPLLDLLEHSSKYWLPVCRQLHPSCNQTSYWAFWAPGWWNPAVLRLVGELSASETAKVSQDDWQSLPGSLPLQCVLVSTETGITFTCWMRVATSTGPIASFTWWE